MILVTLPRQEMVPKLLKSGVLWTKFEVRGPRKWTSKINYICICDEKNAKKKFLKPWIHSSTWA